MFQRSFAALALLACAPLHLAHAAPTPLSGTSLLTAYTHSTAADIISYDWTSSSSLYYMTSLNYSGIDVWLANGGSPVNYYTSSNFAGASVVAIGNYVYFNDSTTGNQQLIHKIDPLAAPAAPTVSTTSNYILAGHQGDLFIAGTGPSFNNNIFYSDLNSSGNLVPNPARSLVDTGDSSGPIAFDLAGNLYYASGYGGSSIYRFSASEVTAAINQTGSPLTVSGHLWLDFRSTYSAEGGASSMTFDAQGNLLVTLTNFTSDSFVARFQTGAGGAYSGVTTKLLTDSGRLGELRTYQGDVYVSSGNSIYKVVPEPGSWALLLAASACIATRRWRRSAGGLALFAGAMVFAGPVAEAGQYSSALQNTTANAPDAGIPGFTGPAGAGVVAGNSVNPLFVGWATRVIQYAPAAGVGSAYATASNALGPVTGDNSSIVSLGDLPAASGGMRPAAGFLTLGFGLAITNGPGADFAAFENGFLSDGSSGVKGQLYGELGFMEASTDGVNFARFPSISLTPAAVGPYGTIDPTNVYNMVGKHVNAGGSSWGTPFDLQSLAADSLVLSGVVDLLNIRFLRIVDVPGDGTFFDSANHPIYDPWQTIGSGGVDFEALGVIHQIPEPQVGGWLVLGLGGVLSSRLRAA